MNAGVSSSAVAGGARPEEAPRTRSTGDFIPLTFWQATGWVGVGTLSFHLAYLAPVAAPLLVVYLMALWELSRARTVRWAFRSGLLTGLLVFGPQLTFFWTLFGPAAAMLWLVLAFWTGLFVALAKASRAFLSPVLAALAAPVLWLAIEYFRSELYHLRFSWINAGYGFSGHLPGWVTGTLGMYGIGFLLMLGVALMSLLHGRGRVVGMASLVLSMVVLTHLPSHPANSVSAKLPIAGVQLEFPTERDVEAALDKLVQQHPEAQLLVLSEYTFNGPVPRRILDWCRTNQRYLLVGGQEPVDHEKYYNTAFVIGPDGETVFQQAKSVPIQFFDDGLPAKEQKVWDSPWGKLGICICYDLSYTRVTDGLVRQGAQAILVPTLDAVHWGEYQHRLHSRVAPVRAAEYGVPLFRLASSGISQCVNAEGQVRATAPFPGEGGMIAGELLLPERGSLPLDRWLGPASVVVAGGLVLWLCFMAVNGWRTRLKSHELQP